MSLNRETITIEDIKKAVCDYTSVKEGVIFKKTRKKEIIKARQTVQYLAKCLTKNTLELIGEKTGGKDHATVIHSYNTISGYLDIYPEWRSNIYNIKEMLI